MVDLVTVELGVEEILRLGDVEDAGDFDPRALRVLVKVKEAHDVKEGKAERE